MTALADRYRASVHEAAHAVSDLALDRPVREVSVVGGGGRCGLGLARSWCAWDAVNEAIIAIVGALAGERARVPAVIEVPVAARAEEVAEAEAEAIWRDPYADAPFDDRSLAERLIAGVALCDEEAEALLRVAELRAEAMLEDTRFQALVLHVAEVLCREGRLDGDAVRIEIERADWRLRWAAEHANKENGYGPPRKAA